MTTTTSWCPSDIFITSWLFTARWSTWPGNHLVPCVAQLVWSCFPIHAHRCLTDSKCFFFQSGLSQCLSVDHFCLDLVDDMVLFHGMVCDGWLVNYTTLPCCGGSGLCTSCERVHFETLSKGDNTQLCRVRSFCITDTSLLLQKSPEWLSTASAFGRLCQFGAVMVT